MKFRNFDIDGPKLISPTRFSDLRGFFHETWKDEWFRANIADTGFVQDNESCSAAQGTILCLHFQREPMAQGKLVRCVSGAIFDVAVDINRHSPNFGRWVSAVLSGENGDQMWVPAGFAHGFCTIAPNSIVSYKVTCHYSRPHDAGIAFDDSDLAIQWPVDRSEAILSDKDRDLPLLATLL